MLTIIMGQGIEFNPQVLDYIIHKLETSEDFDVKRFTSGTQYLSAADMVTHLRNRTPLGIRIYEAGKWLYDRREAKGKE